ncbi:MAG: glycoside hydrolase family 43 protein [Odoribacteraceae bacterium]|jgi:hypothetical protein|nr:glycoside hydrolase family 43 protein [Odoribacteraceae bacterium]
MKRLYVLTGALSPLFPAAQARITERPRPVGWQYLTTGGNKQKEKQFTMKKNTGLRMKSGLAGLCLLASTLSFATGLKSRCEQPGNSALIITALTGNGYNGELKSNASPRETGAAETARNHPARVAGDEGYRAYLFVYFTGNSGDREAIRFAVSRDGYNYKALNNNQPVINSADISAKGGVRDPHILRGVDGNTFYMVVTDMKASQGWSSNHGIVLLKSTDLINWTHSKIDIKATYPEFSTINRAWAPQTIYDPDAQKYMIYWSMNSPSLGHDVIHYAYANADFTALEGTPQVLFHHPRAKSCIDGDIIFKAGQSHLFFKTEGDGNGIKKAVSNTLTGGYLLQDRYLQQTTEAVEGSCVFRLINQEKYILMYDLYTSGKYQFTESDDLENFKVADASVSMNFAPRHGTVIPITEEEVARLTRQWGQSLTLEIITPGSPAVKKQNWMKNERTGAVLWLEIVAVAGCGPRMAFNPDAGLKYGVARASKTLPLTPGCRHEPRQKYRFPPARHRARA